MKKTIKLHLCGGEHPVSQYPLGLGYLKANCESNDFHVEIVQTPKELCDCDMIGLSANAWGMKEAYDIMRNTPIPVILGGQATLWDGCLGLGFRHVIKGEGEIALRKILNGDNLPEMIQETPVKNIDDFSYPIRGRCPKTVPILTSRGCPYHCNFCSSKTFWNGVRFHSAEYFINEVKYISSNYHESTELYILDDLFIAKPSRFFEIHKLWMANAFNKRFSLESFVRSNMFTEEIGLAMKEMGFQSIRFGAESGSDRMLKLLNKQTTVADHQRTIDIACRIGLPVTASFMYDLPGETEEDRQATKNFVNSNKGRLAVRGNYKFKAFPGTVHYAGEDLLTVDMRVR
jgi:radical SAM superfamily enzyme YgiQ (UPF0313 family)